jgi:uncharacterized protein (DUF488 family)
MAETQRRLLTVGHSNHSAEHFQDLLTEHGVEVLVDVRSWPRSRYVEWADQRALRDVCGAVNVKYLFLGDLLGGRPDDPRLYDDDGHVLYGKVARTDDFQRGIERLSRGLEKCQIAIMCSEENPEHCHRRLLVARVMLERGCAVVHIRGNGNLDFEREPIGASQESLFDDGDSQWRSSLSVSRKRRRRTFSNA